MERLERSVMVPVEGSPAGAVNAREATVGRNEAGAVGERE